MCAYEEAIGAARLWSSKGLGSWGARSRRCTLHHDWIGGGGRTYKLWAECDTLGLLG